MQFCYSSRIIERIGLKAQSWLDKIKSQYKELACILLKNKRDVLFLVFKINIFQHPDNATLVQ